MAERTLGRTVGLAVVCAASFIAVADTTIVSVALPSMRRDLGLDDAASPWVFNAYAVSFGGLLLLAGRLGDLHGRRRLFLVGLALFGAGSLLGGLASGTVALLAGRFLQGVGAAAFVPTSLALLTTMFPERRRYERAVGVYGAMAAAGFVVGMVGGGVITELGGWRWVLLVNVPVALVTGLTGARVLPEGRVSVHGGAVDIGGGLTATSVVACLMLALAFAGQRGWTSLPTVAAAAAAVALLAVLAAVERAHDAPILPGSVLCRARVLVPNLAIALQSMVGISWLYLLTLFLQEVLGHAPLATGLLFAPMTAAALLGAPLGGGLVNRVGAQQTGCAGLALVGAGLAGMLAATSPDAGVVALVGAMVVGETGFMMSNVALTVAGTRGLDETRSGLAAGVLNTSIQVGGGLGLAAVATVVAASAGPGADAAMRSAALRGGLWACVVFCAVAFTLVASPLGRRAMSAEEAGLRRTP